MLRIKHRYQANVSFKCAFVIFWMVLMITGCASTEPKQFADNIKGAQLIVEPTTFHLGVAWMLSKDIVFKGKGYTPGENFCVELTGSEDVNSEISIPICCGVVDESGKFNAKAKKLVKAGYLLNAEVTTGEKGYLIVINQPPIPAGAYQATARGFNSKLEAKVPITVQGPTVKDRFMDWMAQLLGKVKKE